MKLRTLWTFCQIIVLSASLLFLVVGLYVLDWAVAIGWGLCGVQTVMYLAARRRVRS